ncbi:MAG: sulfatase-like hydrolase/transferase [Pontiellaceae bacterium]|nr:sulfatase-like hydrolase/transferase [Pontiellaceae bacterium]
MASENKFKRIATSISPLKKYSCLALIALGIPAAVLTAPSGKPNVVIILADDQGYADVSYNPHHPVEVNTPNIDALARAGVICTQGYVSGHVCSPTRAGLMTGRCQQRSGIYTAGQGGSGMPLEERWMPMHLKQGGYVCGAFGKWHLGLTEEYNPVNRGFDCFYGFMGRGAHDYFDYDSDSAIKFGGSIYRNLEVLKGESGYLTTKLTQEAVDFIHREKDKPFFAYVAYNAVHAPAQAPEKDIRKFDTGDTTRNILMAMLYHLDLGVGEIVKALKDAGVYENTLIFYLSDNGGAPNMHASNKPLRGFKGEDFEGGVRVPFIVSWPEKLKAGTVCDVPVWSIDILATALAAAGLDPLPDSKPLDGKNMLPVLSGDQDKLHDTFYWSSGDEGKWAVRSGDWKIVFVQGKTELFNLTEDPGETKNILSEHPEKAGELTKIYNAWLAEMPDPVKGSKQWNPDHQKKKPAKKKKKK